MTDPDHLARIRARYQRAHDRYIRIGLCAKSAWWQSGWRRALRQAMRMGA